MKAIKAEEIRELSIEELQKKLDTFTTDLSDLEFKHSVNQLESPILLRSMRKDIARINTILTEKQETPNRL